MMQCPQCAVAMAKKKMPEGGVFWQCPSCSGRAATLPLLRRHVDPGFIQALWRQVQTATMASRRACPCCHAAMKEIAGPTGQGQLLLDICAGCQLVWFDPGEISTLPRKAPPPTEPELPPVVQERLALLKAEAMLSTPSRLEWEGQPESWWQWLPGALGLPVELNQSVVTQYPWCTWVLAAAIFVISLAGFLDLEWAAGTFGLIPSQFERLSGLTMLSSFFLHAGAGHLLGNLYFFLVFADNVEDCLGRRYFLFLLLSATLFGNILHIVGDPRSTIPCLGASGGISGLLAFYTLQFPQARIGFFLYRVVFWGRWLQIPVWLWFAGWICLQCLLAWQQLHGLSNVSALAHLGGVMAGIAFWSWNRRRPAT